ncbi:MAG TPA: hypothetical protein VNU95_13975 [Candidatus Acidoferrales bacterium]|jgi:hypothetical protein|nr:hypothetical protein [Candidatus Acidoferrales bacterium]
MKLKLCTVVRESQMKPSRSENVEQPGKISVKDHMKTNMMVAIVWMLLAKAAHADIVQVPATANPWLAGMVNGSSARRGDSAPKESPVTITHLTVEGGDIFSFSATGSVNHGMTLPFFPPNGESLISHYLGAENGIADIVAPFTSLIGVFLGPDQPNQRPAPPALDFRTAASRDSEVLAPALKQPFFIGNGLTSSGTAKQIIAPPGATRLLLGVMDEYYWADNEGSFAVQVTKVGVAPPIQVNLHPSLNPTAVDEVPNPAQTAPVTNPPNAPMVTPGPGLQIFTAIELVWPSLAGFFYQVQWSPSLDQSHWVNFGQAIPGTGADLSMFDSTRTHPQGFYRVEIVSQPSTSLSTDIR